MLVNRFGFIRSLSHSVVFHVFEYFFLFMVLNNAFFSANCYKGLWQIQIFLITRI